jgi:hypothetical protein
MLVQHQQIQTEFDNLRAKTEDDELIIQSLQKECNRWKKLETLLVWDQVEQCCLTFIFSQRERIKHSETSLIDADTEIEEMREELVRHKVQLQSCKTKILQLEANLSQNEPVNLGDLSQGPSGDKKREKHQREAQRRRTIRGLITELRHSLPHHVQVRGW